MPGQARAIAAWANAKLELAASMSDRREILNRLGVDIREMWSIGPNGISADTSQDTDDVMRVLHAHPTLIDLVGRPGTGAADRGQVSVNTPRARIGLTPNPLRMSAAIERYVKALSNGAPLVARTVTGKSRALAGLCSKLPKLEPPLSEDPWVHQVESFHLAAFVDQLLIRDPRAGKAGTRRGNSVSASTVLKLVSDFKLFFDFARDELQSTKVNPADGLEQRIKRLRTTASAQKEHYAPYTDEHLKAIFEPCGYLAANNRADYFWAPLLGLHLGARLGEIVTLRLDAFEKEPVSDVWFFHVIEEDAKNKNSIRRLPVTDRLIELGFLKYVQRLRELGATHLFPYFKAEGSTWETLPSKNCTRQYALYLDRIGLSDPRLVFHSFRHTVVTALQDGQTPLADAMQITGHQAMDHALATQRITAQQAQSVHLDTYTHADVARMNVSCPMARLKGFLDRCIQVELDYSRLKIAAAIVLEHVRTERGKFKSGWPTLRRRHTDSMLERLKSA